MQDLEEKCSKDFWTTTAIEMVVWPPYQVLPDTRKRWHQIRHAGVLCNFIAKTTFGACLCIYQHCGFVLVQVTSVPVCDFM